MAGLLEGRVAIVTGGGGGPRRGHLREARLGRRGHRRGRRLAREGGEGRGPSQGEWYQRSGRGGRHLRPPFGGAMADEVARGLGGVDILINNAAVYPRRAWTEIEEEEWDRVMAVNLKGYFLCARAVYLHEGAGTG